MPNTIAMSPLENVPDWYGNEAATGIHSSLGWSDEN